MQRQVISSFFKVQILAVHILDSTIVLLTCSTRFSKSILKTTEQIEEEEKYSAFRVAQAYQILSLLSSIISIARLRSHQKVSSLFSRSSMMPSIMRTNPSCREFSGTL